MATILVVDDRPTNRQFLLTLLSYTGHRLLEAGDGQEALGAALAERPDLVVTDILMPTMDGYKFVREMRSEPTLAATPVIFYSAAYSTAEARTMAEVLGVRTVLSKPSEPQVILDAVNRELGGAGGPVSPTATSTPGLVQASPRELSRIGETIDSYLADLRSAKEMIDRIVNRGDELFKERERLRPLADQFAEKIRGLQTLAARLTAIEELSLRMASERSPERVVQTVAEAAARLLGAERAAVCVLDPREETVAILATHSMDADAIRPQALVRDRLPGSLLEARAPVRVARGAAGPPALPPGVVEGAGFLGISIRSGPRLLGWMQFSDKQHGADFDSNDERILASLAAQFAVVYENAVLYETVQRHAAQLQVAIAERERAEIEHRESETRFRQMAESIDEVFFLTDPETSHILYVNPAYERIWGLSCKSLYEDPRSWTDSVHPDDRERAYAAFAQSAATGTFDFTYRIVRPEGDVRWIRARGFPIRNDAGAIYRVAGIAEDVTRRKSAEHDLARTNRALKMLSSCNMALVRATGEEALLQDICALIVEVGGYRVARVRRQANGEEGRFDTLAHVGDCPPFLDDERFRWAVHDRAGAGPSARAVATGVPVLMENLADQPFMREFAEDLRRAQIGAGVFLPLRDAGRVFGVLVVYTSAGIGVIEEEFALLQELANDLAFGIEAIRARAERDSNARSLASSLEEKEALLKEVHHRVKNNMQVVTSLLRLESGRVSDEGTRLALRTMQNRILSMAVLHETLYKSGNFARVDLDRYLRQLAQQVMRSHQPGADRIETHLDIAATGVNLDQAVPCGLIVNELISNSLKHAFPMGRRGAIWIAVHVLDDGRLRLQVRDDGVGVPEEFEPNRRESLGLTLVSDLVRQLQGSLTIGSGPGASFEVVFVPDRSERVGRLFGGTAPDSGNHRTERTPS